MIVSEALREARIRAGLTQRQLAEMFGVTQTCISDIEIGRRGLHEKYLAMLPPEMQPLVRSAMIRQHEAAISRINGAAEAV